MSWLQDVSGQTQQGDGSGYGAAGAGAAAGGAAAATQVATPLLTAICHILKDALLSLQESMLDIPGTLVTCVIIPRTTEVPQSL